MSTRHEVLLYTLRQEWRCASVIPRLDKTEKCCLQINMNMILVSQITKRRRMFIVETTEVLLNVLLWLFILYVMKNHLCN